MSLIFNEQAPISAYKTEAQIAYLKANLVESLALMLSLLNIGKNMDVRQVSASCDLIIEEPAFKILKPIEFREAFSRGVRGYYGKIYDVVDISILFNWIRAYIEERFEEVERYRSVELSALKAESKKPLSGAIIANIPAELLKDPRKVKQPNEAPIAPRAKTIGEVILDGYLAEFDKLDPFDPKSPIKLVEYDGEILDISGYCNKRQKEARSC